MIGRPTAPSVRIVRRASAAGTERVRRAAPPRALATTTVIFSGLYLLSDLIEAIDGGFSPPQLWLTLVAEAAIPFLVVGLYLAQRPRIGALGLVSAMAYAYAYAFFTYTVAYALAEGTPDFAALEDDLGAAMTIHGAIMVLAGIGFGTAVIRAGVLPRWTGGALIAGVVLVALTQGQAEVLQVAAAAVRDLAFAGMGVALLRESERHRPPTPAYHGLG